MNRIKKLTQYGTIFMSLLSIFGCINPQKSANKDKIVSTMATSISKKFKSAPQMTIEEFTKLEKDSFVLVDVRPQEERDISTLPGAISISEFHQNKENYKDKKVVAYCTIGFRSSKWVTDMKKTGLNAFNLKESALGWAHRGFNFVDKNGETKRLHVYEEAWNFLPDGYTGVFDD